MTAVVKHWPESGDPADIMATEDLADFARTVAELLASKCRHVPDDSRREMAEYICDVIANALYDIGGRLDGAAFLALCDPHKVPA